MKKNALLTCIIVSFFWTISIAQTIPAYIPKTGLIGWWPFNGNANDESGIGNNGVVYGAKLTADRFGNPNSAYSFNGISDFIDVPKYNQSIDSEFTISLWVKIAYSSTYQVFLSHGPKSSGHFEIYSFDVTHKLSWYTKDMCSAQSTKIIDDDSIHHIVINQHKGLLAFYVDNVLVGTRTCTGRISPIIRDLNFGRVNDTGASSGVPGCYSKGIIDDIAIWNRSLTTSEIKNVFKNPTKILEPKEAKINIHLNPNPVIGSLFISSDDKIDKVEIINLLGQRILTQNNNSTQLLVDMTEIPSGVYIVRINNTYLQKIIKM
jgi:hypothetical protein